MTLATSLDTLRQDIRYALRTLRNNPAFALTAVLTLALGIGGNTAIFTVIRAVLLRPLEYREPDRLVYFSLDNPRKNLQNVSFSLDQFREMQSSAQSFVGLGAYGRPDNATLSGTGEPETLKVARVSANFLDILGVQPAAGRSFLPVEDQRGGPCVAMISTGLWTRKFAADPHIAGKPATLDTASCTIIGVLPEGFEFPYAGVEVWFTRPSEWSLLPARYWGLPLLTGFARLKPEVTLDQARAELEVLQQQYVRAHPSPLVDGTTMHVLWLKERLVANVRPMLWLLFGAVGMVLLIACANVASLLLARATSRSREFAVRAAIGAPRGRLMRQLLAESLVLASAGGMVGVLFAGWALQGMRHVDLHVVTPGSLFLPGLRDMRLDGMVLAFTVALSMATGVLFGLFPSLQVSRPDLVDLLRQSGATASGRRGPFDTRGLLVVGQIALSIVLLIGAALLMESFARLHSVDPGFQPANLLTMRISLPPARYDTDPKRVAFFEQLLPRVEASPGVRSAAMAMTLPTTTWIRTNITAVEGRPDPDPDDPASFGVIQSVTPGYFQTLGIPLVRGREFNRRDNSGGAPPVIVVNESFAKRLWPDYPGGPDPIGRHVKEAYDKNAGWMEVVGIAADIHEGGLASNVVAEFYVPCVVHPPQTAYLAIRTQGDPLALAGTIRAQVEAVDPDQAVSEVRTMDAVFQSTMGQRRLTMVLLGVFAGVALLLAVIGIYGAIAYSVAQRTQEMGIRRALGARQGDIVRLMLRQGLRLALPGVALGVLGSLALTRVMTRLLFQVSATDPATFIGIAILFVGVALSASWMPARRAARIDPMTALRVG
jgi:putative ABC transport system permease protein